MNRYSIGRRHWIHTGCATMSTFSKQSAKFYVVSCWAFVKWNSTVASPLPQYSSTFIRTLCGTISKWSVFYPLANRLRAKVHAVSNICFLLLPPSSTPSLSSVSSITNFDFQIGIIVVFAVHFADICFTNFFRTILASQHCIRRSSNHIFMVDIVD